MKLTLTANKQSDLLGDEYMRDDVYVIEATDDGCSPDFIIFVFDGIGDVFVSKRQLTALLRAFNVQYLGEQ